MSALHGRAAAHNEQQLICVISAKRIAMMFYKPLDTKS